MTVRKAVFPVAGLGTRFLPATKASPKEMLPIVDKPLIQYAVEDAIKAGVTELIFVTSSRKHAIEDHFDSNFELEATLEARGKNRMLELVREITPKNVSCVYVRQSKALGLGHAILCAKDVVGNEPFAVLLADDLIRCHEENCLQQMLKIYQETRSSVVAVEKITDSSKYGVIDYSKDDHGFLKLNAIVEKPAPADAPSDYGVAGRYLLTPEVFNFLEQVESGVGGEIQLTDGIAALMRQQAVYACSFTGKRFDCGDKLGYLQATIACALEHPELAVDFRNYLNQLSL
jgi:UTP--glucose-1-phosphate uridylyltransferase